MSRPHLRDPKLEAFWRATLAKWIKSQLNIRDFCKRHRLSEPSFYAWRREIAARDGKSVAKPASGKSKTTTRRSSTLPRPSGQTPSRKATKPTPRPSFVTLRVVPDTPLELVLRTGYVLRIPPGYDAGHLRAVVTALEAQPC